MILSGARGVLQRIDATRKTVTLKRRAKTEDYECADSFEPSRWEHLVGKMVDVQLHDFLVVDISEHSEQATSAYKSEV